MIFLSSQIGWCIAVLIANEKGADLFKLELKSVLNKSVPFFTPFFTFSRRENVKKISVIMVVVFLIVGCAPSRSAWVSSKDGWVGTTF